MTIMRRNNKEPVEKEDFSNLEAKDCVSCKGFYDTKQFRRCVACRNTIHKDCHIKLYCIPCCCSKDRSDSTQLAARLFKIKAKVPIHEIIEERPTGPTINARCEGTRRHRDYESDDDYDDDYDDNDYQNGTSGKNYDQYCKEYDPGKKYYLYIPKDDQVNQEEEEFFYEEDNVMGGKYPKRSTIRDTSMMYSTRNHTFETMWSDIQSLISNLLLSLHSKVTDPMGDFISRNYPSITLERLEQMIKGTPGTNSCTLMDSSLSPFLLLDTLDPLPAIILHNSATTGEITTLLEAIQGNVMTRLHSRSLYPLYDMEVFRPPFIMLQPSFCKSFKDAIATLCQKFTNSTAFSMSAAATTKSNTAYNIEQLKYWYNSTYTTPLVRQTARRFRERHQKLTGVNQARVYQTPAIVYLEDFEKWDPTTLNNLINALNIYRRFIPFVLMFGIRTSQSIIQDRFTFDQISTLRFKSFHLPSQIENFDHLTKIIYATNQRLLTIGPKLYNYLYQQFIDHHLSVASFTNTLKFALAEHFFYNSRLSFLAIPKQISLFINKQFNDDTFGAAPIENAKEEQYSSPGEFEYNPNVKNEGDDDDGYEYNSNSNWNYNYDDVTFKKNESTEDGGTSGNEKEGLRSPTIAKYDAQARAPSDSEELTSSSSSSNPEHYVDNTLALTKTIKNRKIKPKKTRLSTTTLRKPKPLLLTNGLIDEKSKSKSKTKVSSRSSSSSSSSSSFTVSLPIQYIKSLGSIKKLLKLEPGLEITMTKIQTWMMEAQLFLCIRKTVLDCYQILLNDIVPSFKKDNLKYYQMMVDISTTKNNNILNTLKSSILKSKESDIPTLVSSLLSCRELLLLCTSYESDVAKEMVTQHIPSEVVILVDELSKTIKYLKQIENNSLKLDDFNFVMKSTSPSNLQEVSIIDQKGWSLQKRKEYELMKGSSKKVKPPFERLLNHLVDKFILPISFDYIYKPIESIPLSEVFYINSIEGLEQRFNTKYTQDFKIQKTQPNEFLKCSCCKSGGGVSKNSEDIQIAFKTYLECGKFINLYDWLNSFCSFHSSEIIDELRAKFSLCVDSIKFQGYIEKTKKRVDHVEKLHV